jgi:tetratricopeptide (TPR) repeat protein
MRTIFGRLELVAFKLVMWLIVIGSFLAVARRAWSLHPTTLPLHYLFICIAAAASLVIILPNVLNRVREMSVAGVKLTLTQLEQQEALLEEIRIETNDPSIIIEDGGVKAGRVKQELEVPFSSKPLKGAQLYQYERLSHRLYRIRDQVKDPSKLDRQVRVNYRDLITYVAKAAFAMGHYTKYLDVAKQILALGDERTYNEEYLIGHAYLWALSEQERSRRNEYLGSANGFLTQAVKKNPNDVKSQFNLGMCLFYQGGHTAGIKCMSKSLALDDSLCPWTDWNVAFALKEMKQYELSLAVLQEIPAGPIWKAIQNDSWLEPPVPDFFRAQYEAIRQERAPND